LELKAQMQIFEVFTDGACSGNPGPGGWGALVRRGDTQYTLAGAELATTNNRMELMAVIKALDSIADMAAVIVVTTDSRYVQDGISSWIKNWKINNWQTAARQPVKNRDLWMQLDSVVAQHNVTWKWVKGHSGHIENDLVDKLARDAIQSLLI
jgi:ribonuclease HI